MFARSEKSNGCSQISRRRRETCAVKFKNALSRMDEAGENFKERGFPGAVRTQEGNELARIQIEVNISQGPQETIGFG